MRSCSPIVAAAAGAALITAGPALAMSDGGGQDDAASGTGAGDRIDQLAAKQNLPTTTADLKNRDGVQVGTATLIDTPNGVLIRVRADGLPQGWHAFHIHRTGTCEAPDFKSAGGHLAAAGNEHGLLDQAGAHLGDMPNVHVGESGGLKIDVLNPDVTLDPDGHVFDEDGSAIVMHAGADDYHTNPAGAAGKRIACGVITPIEQEARVRD